MSQNLFSYLVRLYPEEFRCEFGEELLDVFNAKCEDARRLGPVSLIYVWLQEILELPGNLFAEYWLLFTAKQLKGGNNMSALSTKRLTMNVFMPLTLAVFLWIINPGYINEFFSTTHGVLIVGCFILILAINAFLIRGSSGNTGSHFWLVALLTIMAFLIIIFGPAFLKVMMFLPADSTVLKTTALITLILFNAGLAIGLFALGRKMIKKRMLIRFISGFLKASNYPPSLTARNLCSSLQHSPIFKQRIQLIISLGILTE